jgi:hypothetical protein
LNTWLGAGESEYAREQVHDGPLRWLVTVACIGCGRSGFDEIPTQTVSYDVVLATPTVELAIEAVDPERTLVTCDFSATTSNHDQVPICELTSATTVSIETRTPDPTTVVHVQLIQLESGAVVQRGRYTHGSNVPTHVQPIEPVDLASSFAVVASYGTLSSSGLDERFNLGATLVDPTTLELARAETGNTLVVVWQVVSIPGAVVRAGTTTLTDSTASVSIAPVDPRRTFVVATRQGGSEEGDHLVRLRVVDGVTLAFARNSAATDVDVSWFVVELSDVIVQTGELAFTGEVATAEIARVDTTHAAVFVTASGGLPGSSAHHPVISKIDLEPTRLELVRGEATDDTALSRWYVVQWVPR